MATEKKKRKRARLKDMQPFEVAAVPTGANKRVFLSLKQENGMKIDLANLEKAQEKLGRIVTVVKSGELTAEAQQDLASKLAEFVGLFGVEEDTAPTTDPVEAASPAELKAELESLKKDLANMTVTAGISDLAVDEQVDAVQAKIDAVLAKIAEPPKAEPVQEAAPEPEVQAAPEPEPQPEPAPEVQAAADSEPEPEVEPEPEPEVSDDAEKNKAETFTADNMKEMFQSFMDGMKSVIKDAVEGATKQVSKQLAAPVTLPASRGTGSIEEFNASEEKSKADDDGKAYLEAFDFNAWIDEDDARLD